MPPVEHKLYWTVCQKEGGKTMSKVFGVHTYELKPGVTEEDFEKFITEEVNPLSFDAGKLYALKGDKGERKGKYLVLVVLESSEVRDKYFGSPEGEPATEEMADEWKAVLQKWDTFSAWTFTDYVEIG
jgi:hypothetical protein